jgi:hypothetical protein
MEGTVKNTVKTDSLLGLDAQFQAFYLLLTDHIIKFFKNFVKHQSQH